MQMPKIVVCISSYGRTSLLMYRAQILTVSGVPLFIVVEDVTLLLKVKEPLVKTVLGC